MAFRMTILLALGMAVLFAQLSASAQPPPRIEPRGYTSSAVCGSCHQAIYDTWKNSLHANSLSDPIFEVAYLQAIKEAGIKAREFCLRCHAPITRVTKDFDLASPITREGITCDFCHTVASVNLAKGREPFRMTPGSLKYGPLRSVPTLAHRTAQREFFTKSEFCGGCHELEGAGGVKILGTYSEWRAGPYARDGRQCQDCHMPVVSAPVVAPGKGGGARITNLINLHNIQGGHSAEQVARAASVKILEVKRDGNRVDVAVQVANVGSGHMLPTGIPSRRVVLTVQARTPRNEVVFSGESVFKKAVRDRSGRELTQDHQILLYTSSVAYDTRLAPGEARPLRFTFPYGGQEPLTVDARLTYLYGAQVLTPQEMRVEMGGDQQRVQ